MKPTRWTIEASALARKRLDEARTVLPLAGTFFSALSLRLAHDPFRDATSLGNGLYSLAVDPVSEGFQVRALVLYLVGDNNRILIKNLKFL